MIARDASFVALVAVTLMVEFSFNPALTLHMGAQIALIFSLFLLYRVSVLTVDRVRRTETWRSLPPHERPAGEHSLVRARERLQQAMLHFAKEASGVACVLLVASLAVSLN